MIDLVTRTRRLAVMIIRFRSNLPKNYECQVMGNQVFRSGTSVGAHYREAKRARSEAEFVSKIQGGLQELEETQYWLELFKESGLQPDDVLRPIYVEANELMAILTTVVRNIKNKTR